MENTITERKIDNPAERTLFGQCMSSVLAHLEGSVIAFLFGTLVFWWFVEAPVWKYIFSVVFGAVNFLCIYNAAHKTAVYDTRSYSQFKPDMRKSLLLTASIWAATLLLWGLYWVTWRFASIDGYIFSLSSSINNMLFYMWTFPYVAIVKMSMGGFSAVGMVIVFAVPLVASVAGYYTGMRRIDLTDKLISGIYEKK